MIEKKLHRFIVEKISGRIEDTRFVHQTHHVLKLRAGEKIILFEDGGFDVEAEIKVITKKEVQLEILGPKEKKSIEQKYLIAAISISKGSTFELIVQKLTELGVREIIPVITSRTVKQSVRLDRLQVISDEALEQSGGKNRVKIFEPRKLEIVLKNYPFQSIAFHQGIVAGSFQLENKVIMYVGPEGGWSNEDLEIFKKNDVNFLSLGPRILRTETAAIVGAFKLMQ